MEDCCAVRGNGKGGYDLAVIGAGSAGFSAAITAAEQGAQVALIGHGTIGGTCVNTGCVPSKTMIRAAETLHQAKSASRFRGIEAHAKVTDWRAVMAEKKALVEGLRQAKYVDLLPAYNSIAYLIERLRPVFAPSPSAWSSANQRTPTDSVFARPVTQRFTGLPCERSGAPLRPPSTRRYTP